MRDRIEAALSGRPLSADDLAVRLAEPRALVRSSLAAMVKPGGDGSCVVLPDGRFALKRTVPHPT